MPSLQQIAKEFLTTQNPPVLAHVEVYLGQEEWVWPEKELPIFYTALQSLLLRTVELPLSSDVEGVIDRVISSLAHVDITLSVMWMHYLQQPLKGSSESADWGIAIWARSHVIVEDVKHPVYADAKILIERLSIYCKICMRQRIFLT